MNSSTDSVRQAVYTQAGPSTTTETGEAGPAKTALPPDLNTVSTEGKPMHTRIRLLVTDVVNQWLEQRCGSKGAALAFYTLFSMAPILVLVIAIAGAVFGEQAARGELFGQLAGLIGQRGADAIQEMLATTHNSGSGTIATVIATLVLIVSATTVFSELKESLDAIWQVRAEAKSGLFNLLRTRLLSFSVVLALGFLLLVSLAISAALALLEHFWASLWGDIGVVLTIVSWALSFCVIVFLFGTIYKLLPQIRLPWRDVLIGAVGTAALFNIGKYIIGIYLGNSGVASSYGAAGSLVAVLLWIYYSAQIFFFGAQFTRQWALHFGSLRDLEARRRAYAVAG